MGPSDVEKAADGREEGGWAEFGEMPGHLIRRMHQASQAVFDTEMAASGFDLTPVQFAALNTIAAHPGIDQASLASAIAFDRATTGGVIDRLEAKGLVRREVSRADRRLRHLHLEPEGARMLARAIPVTRRVQDLMLVGLNHIEKASLLRLLRKALTAVGDVSRPSSRNSGAASARSHRSSA